MLLLLHARREYGRVEVQLYTFFISGLDGNERLSSRPGRFTSGKREPFIRWQEAVCARADLDVWESSLLLLPGIKPRFIGRPSRNHITVLTDLFRLPVNRCLITLNWKVMKRTVHGANWYPYCFSRIVTFFENICVLSFQLYCHIFKRKPNTLSVQC
jgi:hypothetical protein